MKHHSFTRLIALLLCLTLFSGAALAAVGYEKLQRGDEGAEVLAMQRALKSLGFDIEPDGKYGYVTRGVVKEFQKKYNLEADGIAGDKTLTLLYTLAPAFKPSTPISQPTQTVTQSPTATAQADRTRLESGDEGADVLTMQQMLKALGYNVTPDGKFGATTKAAVKQFQSLNSLSVDGIAGAQTLTLLKQLYAKLGDPTATATVTATPTATPTATAQTGRTRLESGDEGADVLTMQQMLKALGYNVTPDGKFGTTTKAAVKQFQSFNSLSVDGIAGAQTLTLLSKLYNTLNNPTATATATATATQTPAAQVTSSAIVTTSGGILYLRQAANKDGKVLARIPNGTRLDVTSRGSYWSGVRYGTINGYVMSSFLTFTGTTTDTPTATPTATATATATQTPPTITTRTARVTGGKLYMREQRSKSSGIVFTLPDKTVITVTGYGDTWCAVTYNGYSGYVMTKFLTFIAVQTATPTPSASPSPDASETVTPTPTATIDRTRLESGDEGADVLAMQQMLNALGYNVALDGKFGATTKSAVKQFQQLNSLSVDGIAGAQTLTLLKQLYDKLINPTATVMVTPTPTPTPTATPPTITTRTARVTGGKLYMREQKSKSSAIVFTLPDSTVITVTAYGDTWCAATYNGYTGYVMTKFLTFIAVATATPTPSASPDASETATVTPTPTPTPTPPPYDETILKRTLSTGATGEDVQLVQSRLVALNYLASSAASGTYDAATVSAVRAFQRIHGLSVDGLAGKQTFTVLFSSDAMEYTDAAESYSTLHIYYQSADKSLVDDIERMQARLSALGYTANVTGKFDETTYMAVLAFQLRNGLTVDGVGSVAMQTKLFSSSAKPASASPSYELEDGAGKIAGPSTSSVQLLHWFNTVKPSLSGGDKLLIFDPATSRSWTLRVYACGNHCDSEPLTLRDTLIMNAAFGKPSWTTHAVYVQLPDGRWTVASMHNHPHLTGSIKANGFDGHLCVHFLRDMSECSANDPDYGVTNQKTIRSKWQSMTGIKVD